MPTKINMSFAFAFTLFLTSHTWAAEGSASTTPNDKAASAGREVKIGERTLVIPHGYEIELAAGSPLVERPISVARDERGRLYVTDSAGMTDRAPKQLETKPHRIRRLEDTDGDGRYDRSTLFAERVMFPEGALWYRGSLYVAAPPEIWKFTDKDDDGIAEERSVWFDGKTLGGCANDLHGPFLGPDGWFYWCKGAFAEQKYTLPNGTPFVTRSSHIFRARPDCTQIEPVLTGGMDNPVNVAFLAGGERILSCTFFQFPEAGRRDGLIHAIYGGVYGKRHDSIYEHKQTGDVMPVLSHQGAAAPCGLIATSESALGGGALDHLFACYFNLHKVVRHELQPLGPTFRSIESDFVFCDHPDFHPTDVFEDADGSLLVVDTGGWYKVCCPTSQLAKPDVLGAVYRVWKAGTRLPAAKDPLGLRLNWNAPSPGELTSRLTDDRLFVRRRAKDELRKNLTAPAIAALQTTIAEHASATARREAAWALADVSLPAARAALRSALADKDVTVKQAAIQAVSVGRDREALESLSQLVLEKDPRVARPAAEALGRLADKRAVGTLFQALRQLDPSQPDDVGAPRDDVTRIREHSLIYALIEIGDQQSIAAALMQPNSSPQMRRAALVALDQLDNGAGLQADQIIPLLDDANPAIKNTATWIVGHRAMWGEALAKYYEPKLRQPPTNEAARDSLALQLGRLGKSPAIQELLAKYLASSASAASRSLALQATTESRLTAMPATWLDELAALLNSSDGTLLVAGIQAARQWPMPKAGHVALKQALTNVGNHEATARGVRLDALLAAGSLTEISPATFAMLLATLHPEESLGERSAAARVLGAATLTGVQQTELVTALKYVGPLDLPKLLSAFERGANESLGLKLVAALRTSSGVRGLTVGQVKSLVAKYPTPVATAAEALLADLNANVAQQAAQLEKMLADMKPGDVRRGHEIFLGKKAACINCHTLGYRGGRLGPDLTNIGKARNERDLLEAIVFPNSSFVRGYEPVIVELEDGRTLTGIIAKESRDEVVLALDPIKTQNLPRREIAEIHPGPVSLMPQGMGNVLTPQEIADLVAFLKAGPTK